MKDSGVPVETFSMTKPRCEEFEDEIDYKESLINDIRTCKKNNINRVYFDKMKTFTQNIYNNSDHIELSHFSGSDITSDNYQQYKDYVQEKTELIVKDMLGNKCSRILLLSDKKDGRFCDAHSTVVLGETQDGKDMWVVEKGGVGENIEILKLSEVIEKICLSIYYKNVEVNVCKKSARELY